MEGLLYLQPSGPAALALAVNLHALGSLSTFSLAGWQHGSVHSDP